MKKLIEKITYFLISKEKGATAVEYALIVALIAMVIIVHN
ncbi:MAG: Flp family type IVb pilin, partial [Actinobacteria bacterium]|nr:Flp family type IVb pilin [Actinomycetota bacterium]